MCSVLLENILGCCLTRWLFAKLLIPPHLWNWTYALEQPNWHVWKWRSRPSSGPLPLSRLTYLLGSTTFSLVPRKQSGLATHSHRFIYRLRPNQHLEMSWAMRGNQATNSGNINPICERGNEIFPFIFNWSLSLFVPSIIRPPLLVRLNSSPFSPSLSRLCKYYLEMNNFTWCSAPLPLSLFSQKWKCVWFTEPVHLQGW